MRAEINLPPQRWRVAIAGGDACIDAAAKGGVDAEDLFPWMAPDRCRVSA